MIFQIALGIPTVPNLRDVGGYKTCAGATVARARLSLPHIHYAEILHNTVNFQSKEKWISLLESTFTKEV